MSFPSYIQYDAMDCGPTCLRMIAKHYGKEYSLDYLRQKSFITREGVSLLGISDAAEKIGFRTIGASLPYEQLREEAYFPCIVHWRQNHFIVVYDIKESRFKENGAETICVADPAHGLIKYTREEFLKGWLSHQKGDDEKGIALLLEPTPEFYKQENEEKSNKAATGLRFLFRYLSSYKKLIIQLILAMLLGSLLQLVFPFLTQSVVDFGINYRDMNFIYLLLAAQLMLLFSSTVVNFVRDWILLHIGSRINISLVSDFLIKVMKLPIAFFDTKMIGDLMQRINDNQRIQQFLTSATLSTLFSLF